MPSADAPSPVAYTVIASLPSAEVADEYVYWLLNGHIQAVLGAARTAAGPSTAGPLRAEVIRLDAQPTGSAAGTSPTAGAAQIEVRYTFPSRGVLEIYLRDHAPGLRADGLARFGPERGVVFRRTIGELAGVLE